MKIATPRPMARRIAKLGAAAVALSFAVAAQQPATGDALSRGAVLFGAGGCANCHTDEKHKGALLAGGRPLKTPFGTFYTPNITPDPTYGIGRWRDADFVRAMRRGVAPDGSHYFPAFPYTSFTNMTDGDLKAVKDYIFAQPAVARPNRPHDIAFPFNLRFLQYFWKLLFFTPGPYAPDPARSAAWNRGAYLVKAVVHCRECHTPRNLLGGLDRDREFAGVEHGPDGDSVPNITPHPTAGIGKWSRGEIANFLETGEDITGDYAGSLMAEVIDQGTERLSEADRLSIAEYLKSVKPIR